MANPDCRQRRPRQPAYDTCHPTLDDPGHHSTGRTPPGRSAGLRLRRARKVSMLPTRVVWAVRQYSGARGRSDMKCTSEVFDGVMVAGKASRGGFVLVALARLAGVQLRRLASASLRAACVLMFTWPRAASAGQWTQLMPTPNAGGCWDGPELAYDLESKVVVLFGSHSG